MPGSPYYQEDVAKLYTEYDPKKAADLLDAVSVDGRGTTLFVDDEGLARLFGSAAVDPLGGLLESCSRLLSLPFVRPDASRQGGRSQAETLRRMTMAMARVHLVIFWRPPSSRTILAHWGTTAERSWVMMEAEM